MTRTDVLIVGAGPSGLVSALLLARWGVRSVVLERNAKTDEHPKAHELNARSIEILRDAGIDEEELAEEASPLEDASRVMFCRHINEELGQIDLMQDPARRKKYKDHLRQRLPYLNLSQSEFEKILVRHALRSPLIDLRFGHCWESLESTGEPLRSTIRGDAAYQVESRFLLGCDGASSRVRRAIGIEMEGPAEIQTFVNAFFKADLRDRVRARAKLFWIIQPEYAGTFIAHHMGKRWVYAVPVYEPWEHPEDFTTDVMKARIQGALGFDVPELEITSMSTWRMSAQIAVKYRCGHVFLVGDAAHRFPPTGGLGMNTGIADAHNLAWKLALVLSGRADDTLLDSYESERRPVAQRNSAESHANFDKIWDVIRALGLQPEGMKYLARFRKFWPLRNLPEAWQRLLIRMLTRVPNWLIGRGLRPGRVRDRVQQAIAAQIGHFDRLGLDLGYVYGQSKAAVTARPGDYVPTTEPGARLPHCWIGPEELGRSTHDMLDYTEFKVLAKSDAPGATKAQLPEGFSTVDTARFPESVFPDDLVLLVRPDGHIAWRGEAGGLHAAIGAWTGARFRQREESNEVDECAFGGVGATGMRPRGA